MGRHFEEQTVRVEHRVRIDPPTLGRHGQNLPGRGRVLPSLVRNENASSEVGGRPPRNERSAGAGARPELLCIRGPWSGGAP